MAIDPVEPFHPAVREWFTSTFGNPTPPQALGWPAIARGESSLILSPTGSGKTLAAFLWCINRLMFAPTPATGERCRVLYVSPLKALAVDVERNLRTPIAGIANVAERRGDVFVRPTVWVRTGDTPQSERARFLREPADIVITTPESLYLLLTSNSREALRSVDTVIVDEIHALVPGKRGAHLALSLERLQQIARQPVQRIGLSATQRPLEETAHFLGGAMATATPDGESLRSSRRSSSAWGWSPTRTENAEGTVGDITDAQADASDADVAFRPVTIVDAGRRKQLELRIEVPVEDMGRIGQPIDIPSGPASQPTVRSTIWSAIHPRLLALIREHRSTLLFVNSRRLAERLAAALNELAGEMLVRAHHGSIARAQRMEIEDKLKAGQIRALVATSSLELGIDMGAIDLVVQIESPPSVASGLQRIGRASHQVDAASRGVVFPKFRGDLLACAAVTRAMHDGEVESARYPRNPLDVLAQQIVAMVAMERWDVDALFHAVRGAAPFATLTRGIFEGVLDMLAGRYPSDEFAELRPRLTWDRIENSVTARTGARRIAVTNGGTIPDRGLYGVFLAGAERGAARVGELDEEMVFESRVGETFLLGASTWRINEITHDRVLVSPAPGEPGKMPFWKGDASGRPLEFGRKIGLLARELRQMPRAAAVERLRSRHDLDALAAENLLQYLADQAAATGVVPDDHTIIVEHHRDELGDSRMCVLTPFGGKVHAPWCMAVAAMVRRDLSIDVETMWTDEGFVVRFPEQEETPPASLMVPAPDEVERLVMHQLGASSLFAARFREAAGRALLLPKRRPGQRAPLWQQRKRAADLLAVAAQFPSFPILLEAYRECLRDVFDIPALTTLLRDVANGEIKIIAVDSPTPSPFAASLLFGYVANYIYDGDAPLAERRAQALSIDQAQLRELLGDAELRELLDPGALDEVERQLQHLDPAYHAKSEDALHDLLLRIGDLTREEIERRATVDAAARIAHLVSSRRALPVRLGGETRYIAVEDASRYRDALGVALPPGLPQALLEPVRDPHADLARRYARTHGPFTTDDVAHRYGLARAAAETALKRLAGAGKLLEGEFRPGGIHREWCDPDVLRTLRRRSLAKLRHEVEPVDAPVFARLLTTWQGVTRPRRGMDALLDAIETVQGAPIPASLLETEVLAARVEQYRPADLDALVAAGEVVWCGLEPIGERDGRIAVYLTDHLSQLRRPSPEPELADRERLISGFLGTSGASFFGAVHAAAGGGYPAETVDALWSLVWKGLVTNDTFHALRALTAPPPATTRKAARARQAMHPPGTIPFRSRRMAVPPTAEGRWSLVGSRMGTPASATEWSAATARQLLTRYGLVSREVAGTEWIPGGWSAVYEVLKAMEDSGRIRRGYFVTGIAAAQFAMPAALDLLRSMREMPDRPEVVHVAATDPVNPYGSILSWPAFEIPESDRGPTRSVGASVILVNGSLIAYLGRGVRQLLVALPEQEPDRSTAARAVAERLVAIARTGEGREGGLLVSEINGQPAVVHPLIPYLLEAGFVPSAMGYQVRRA